MAPGAKAGRHEADEIWTGEFQADTQHRHIEMIRRGLSPNGGEIAGMSPWILKDFRAPVRVLPGIQDGYNREGLVSEEGERTLAFEVVRDFDAEFATGQ